MILSHSHLYLVQKFMICLNILIDYLNKCNCLWSTRTIHYKHRKYSDYCILRSAEVRCDSFRSSLIRDEFECSFLKMVSNLCSGKTVWMIPSRMTMTSRLLRAWYCSMSNSMWRPSLLVSLPITLRSSSDKLEKSEARAATRVRILCASSRGGTGAGGKPPGQKLSWEG